MLYQYGNTRIELMSQFLYEINKYIIYPNRVELLESKFISSSKELNLKKDIKIEYHGTKNKHDYLIETSIILLGAPESFVKYLKICD